MDGWGLKKVLFIYSASRKPSKSHRFVDLSLPDPYWRLPILTGLTFLAIMEVCVCVCVCVCVFCAEVYSISLTLTASTKTNKADQNAVNNKICDARICILLNTSNIAVTYGNNR